MKSAEATRVTLLTRLTAAAALLLGHGHKDSAKAVLEAQESIKSVADASDITTAPNEAQRAAESPLLMGDLTQLRSLRQWHYDQYYDFAKRAKEMQKKSDSRMFQRDSRDAFERTANGFLDKANTHLRFVRHLNAFFPASDSVI